MNDLLLYAIIVFAELIILYWIYRYYLYHENEDKIGYIATKQQLLEKMQSLEKQFMELSTRKK